MRTEGKNIICQDFRGNEVRRPNKIAAQYCRKKPKNKSMLEGDLLTLAVKGTLDSLGRIRFNILKVHIKHPVESGYTKVSYVLKKNKHKFDIV